MQPTASHATNARVMRNTRAVSRNDVSSCRRSLSGTRQSRSVMSAFCTTRSAILVRSFSALKPGFLFSTTKPFT